MLKVIFLIDEQEFDWLVGEGIGEILAVVDQQAGEFTAFYELLHQSTMVEPYHSLHLNLELLLVENFRVLCHATAARTVEVLDDHGELHRLKLELREIGSQIIDEEVFGCRNPGHCASLFHLLPGWVETLDGWANERDIALLVEVVTDFETGIPIRGYSVADIED